LGGEGDEQAGDLVAGEWDQRLRGGTAGVLVGPDDDEEGMGKHGEGCPAGPGGVSADLVFIRAREALAGLERFLNAPS
jgi:hypothetical protein